MVDGYGGKATEIKSDQAEFKLVNLETMMMGFETASKLEHNTESLLKKIDKAYSDIDPRNSIKKLKVTTRNLGDHTVNKYLETWVWDDTKYPRKGSLVGLLGIMSDKIAQAETSLRIKLGNWSDVRQQKTNASKTEGSSLTTRDLNPLFAIDKNITQAMFPRGDTHITTLIAIVPTNQVKEWTSNYERLSEGVVPGSAVRIQISTDIGQVEMYRLVCLRKYVEEVKSNSKNNLKVNIREFEWDVQMVMEKEALKKKLEKDADKCEGDLKSVCEEVFKDIYATYVHLKMLKVIIDCTMRFSEDFRMFGVQIYKGRDRKVLQIMINRLEDGPNKGMYGFKEDAAEEDFFPFVHNSIELALE